MRAHSIFESKGLLKLLKEIKNKLKMLNSSVKMAAEMVAEGIESGEESSPERMQGSDIKGKK